MKNNILLIVCLLIGICVSAFAVQEGKGQIPPLLYQKELPAVVSDLQAFIPQLIQEARVPGLQIALIREGKIAWHQAFGVRNAKTGEPVTDDTIFEAASLTKPFFAYYVMKLAEQGVLSLDKPIIGYLPQPEVEKELGHPLDEKGFHRDWFEKITARHVLSHSSGMPHGETGKPLPLFFEPGTRWKYSADGYFFLQKAVELLKGDSLEKLMQKEVLDPLGMSRSCLVWKDDYERTMANGQALWQWGDYGIFRNYVIAYPKEKTGVVYLTNSFYGLGLCPAVVAHSLGGQELGRVSLGYLSYDSPVYRFAWKLWEKGPQAVGHLADLKRSYPEAFTPDALSLVLEVFQGEASLTPQIIALLEYRLGEQPKSGKVLLDLARAYLAAGDISKAKICLEKAGKAEEDKVEPALIEWNQAHAQALENPVKLEEEYMKVLAGDYSPRHITFREGRFYYFREGGVYSEPRPLVAMSRDTFVLEGAFGFRLKIEFDDKGNPLKLVGLYEDGRRDETLRTK